MEFIFAEINFRELLYINYYFFYLALIVNN